MNEMSLILLGIVTQSLQGGSPAQHPILNHAMGCTPAWFELSMYAQYKSDDDATFSYVEDAVDLFNTFIDILILEQASTKATAKASALKMELMKMRMVHKETNAAGLTLSKKWWEMNTLSDYISYVIDLSKELHADFNYLKIDVMCHWLIQNRRYGALQ